MRNHFARQKLMLNHRQIILYQKTSEWDQLKFPSTNASLNIINPQVNNQGRQQTDRSKRNTLSIFPSRLKNQNMLVKDIIHLHKKQRIIDCSNDCYNVHREINQIGNKNESRDRKTKTIIIGGDINRVCYKELKNLEQGQECNRSSPESIRSCINHLSHVSNPKSSSIHRNSAGNIQSYNNIAKTQPSQIKNNHNQLINQSDPNQPRQTDRLNNLAQDRKLTLEKTQLQLKHKIKIKLSRRHMYHTLKHRSQVLNKIKFNNHHFPLKTNTNNPQETFTTFKICPVHKTNHLSNTKPSFQNNNHNVPIIHNLRQLRVDSKPMTLQLSSDNKVMLKIKTLLNSSEDRKVNLDIYKQVMANMPIQMQKRDKKEINQFCRRNKEQIINNVFRELTPWHGEVE